MHVLALPLYYKYHFNYLLQFIIAYLIRVCPYEKSCIHNIIHSSSLTRLLQDDSSQVMHLGAARPTPMHPFWASSMYCSLLSLQSFIHSLLPGSHYTLPFPTAKKICQVLRSFDVYVYSAILYVDQLLKGHLAINDAVFRFQVPIISAKSEPKSKSNCVRGLLRIGSH